MPTKATIEETPGDVTSDLPIAPVMEPMEKRAHLDDQNTQLKSVLSALLGAVKTAKDEIAVLSGQKAIGARQNLAYEETWLTRYIEGLGV